MYTRLEHAIGWRFLLVTVGTAMLLCLVGCFWVSTWMFEPVKGDKPIRMFDRYVIEASGLARPPQNCDFTVSFAQPHFPTANIDTIPIFVIDSLCLEGECLGGVACYRPMTEDEYERSRGPEAGNGPRKLAPDLIISPTGQLHPGYFLLDTYSSLSSACKERDVRVRIHAVLLDRVAGNILAQESRLVQFEIKKVTRPTLE